jgi:hypothetical protein
MTCQEMARLSFGQPRRPIGVGAARMQARLNLERSWEYSDVPQGGSVWVFAVD